MTDNLNPFAAVQEVPSQAAVPLKSEAITSSPFESETSQISSTVTAYQRLVHSALSRRNRRNQYGVIEQLKAFGRRLLNSVAAYARKAIEIASHKFVIEFCAMVMTALLGALTKKGYRSAEVSTGSVFYRPEGTPAASTTQQPGYRGNDSHNPFAEWSNPSPAWR